MRRLLGALFCFYSALAIAPLTTAAQAPPGHSARLFGVHDWTGSSVAYLTGATASSCDHGWLTNLTYIDGDASVVAPPDGVSIIARLDWNGSESVPLDAGTRGTYITRFVESVRRSPNNHVWIVGNEPNFTIAGPLEPTERFIDPYIPPFVDAYTRIRPQVHALSGHADDVVLLPAPSPWSPCFLEGLARMIRGIDANGVSIDGFAIHPGTRHPSDSQRAGRVTSGEGFHNCNIGSYRDGSGQFSVLDDFIATIDAEGYASAPLYISETAHNTDAGGVVNHVNEDRGFFTAIYAHVDAYNRSHAGRIRAVTPYRWTTSGDGSGRDHSIEGKAALQADHRRSADLTWTTITCGPTGCLDDSDCAAADACDVPSGECRPRGSACPCAAGQVCRLDTGECAPANTGAATLSFTPGTPAPGATVRVDVFATEGYTNVSLDVAGPLPGGSPTATYIEVSPGFHWLYDVGLPAAGTYRFTFTADPASTVYGVAYLNVIDPAVADAGAVDGGMDTDAGRTAGPDASPSTGDAGRTPDAGPGRLSADGCGCRVGGAPRRGGGLLLLLALIVWRLRRSKAKAANAHVH